MRCPCAVRLPAIDGLPAMEKVHEIIDGAPIIVMMAFEALETAVKAMRNGAFEDLLKPFDSP